MLLRGGYVVNSDRKFLADVLIENNTIKQIGQNIVVGPDTKVIDVSNKLIIPGGIDPSTNFNLSGKEILLNESKAALAGGTTTIITQVKEVNESNVIESLKSLQIDMKSKLFCNYGFYVTINPGNEDSAKNIEILARNHGINSFQMTIGTEITNNIITILKKCKELQCLIRLRVEDRQYSRAIEEELLSKGITGPEGFYQSHCLENEIEAMYKILKLNYAFPCALIIPQVMNEELAKLISKMKKEGRPIFCETITAALVLSNEKYFSNNWDDAASIITDPPLRNNQNSALIRGIQCGDIDMLASQHTSVTNEQRLIGKRDFRDIPHGLIGSEERLAVLWDRGVKTGFLNECEFVSVTSTNAAKIFNLYPERGHIAIGSVADLVIWNPDKQKTINHAGQHLKNDINIFEGLSLQGVAEIVIVNGVVKFQQNEFVGNATGEKVELKSNCKMVVDKLARYESLREFGKLIIQRDGDISNNVPMSIKCVNDYKSTDINSQMQEAKNPNLVAQRPLTSGGNRNMQESSFSLSGSQIDDGKPKRSTIRTNHPPGGKSSLIF